MNSSLSNMTIQLKLLDKVRFTLCADDYSKKLDEAYCHVIKNLIV